MLRKRRKRHSLFLSACLIAVLVLCGSVIFAFAQKVPQKYQDYFVENRDTRSLPEKMLNKVGLTRADVGRSFALICGISNYPNMKGKNGDLKPAAEDLRKLQAYLKQHEFFDEVVVLRNDQVTLANLEYFLQTYFPARLKKFPKSRFLFAYTGHGMTENNKGYLLKSTASSLDDKGHAIHVNVLKVYIDEVVAAGHQVLVLLNSCHSGTFLKRSYGDVVLLPKYPGAHAITAGGPSELAWHIDEIGSGSIFYEKLLAGISGIADAEKDDIVTGNELYSYLRREIQMVTDQGQNPQMGDISLHGSRGEFFFLNRDAPLVQQKRVTVSGGTVLGQESGHHIDSTPIGVAIGGMLGYVIGNGMKQYDRQMLNLVYDSTPSGQTSTWVNPDSGHQYQVTPQLAYTGTNNHTCRKAEILAVMDGRRERTYATACRDITGQWQLQ